MDGKCLATSIRKVKIMKNQSRKYTNLIIDLVDQGVLDKRTLIIDLLNWYDEADVKEFCEAYEFELEEE